MMIWKFLENDFHKLNLLTISLRNSFFDFRSKICQNSKKRYTFRFTFQSQPIVIQPNNDLSKDPKVFVGKRRGKGRNTWKNFCPRPNPSFERIPVNRDTISILVRPVRPFGQKGTRKWFQARVNPSRRLISLPLQDETTSLSIFSRGGWPARCAIFGGIRGSSIQIFWPN